MQLPFFRFAPHQLNGYLSAMQALKLPIGIQSFHSIRSEGYHYVDKTQLVHQLVSSGKYIFLSRPRRFGKSLLVSTLQELFLGNKSLFEGLWIADKWDWKPHPVILIDFNLMEYKTQPLEVALARQMDQNAEAHGVVLSAENFKDKFDELFTLLFANGQQVVVLIDEYEKPITDFLGEDEEKMLLHVDTLRNFFSVLKSRDAAIRFAFLTGVSKIGKMGVFSGLNNVRDITMLRQFSALCGYTQNELEANFPQELDSCMDVFHMDREELLGAVKKWYNGYSWDGLTPVYNPFSILNFLGAQRFANFWFETGTPTFLVRKVREGFVLPQDLDQLRGNELMLDAATPHSLGTLALLFQTGYLTIKSIEGPPTDRSIHLGFPNFEVRDSFLRYLLSEYKNLPPDQLEVEVVARMKEALRAGDLAAFFQIIRTVFASVPYPVFKTHEDYFHALMHVVLVLTGMMVQAEAPTNRGRIDQVLETGDRIYLFEYKLDGTPEEALAQIRQMGYAEKYHLSNKPITLVGIAFSTADRNIAAWKEVPL